MQIIIEFITFLMLTVFDLLSKCDTCVGEENCCVNIITLEFQARLRSFQQRFYHLITLLTAGNAVRIDKIIQ